MAVLFRGRNLSQSQRDELTSQFGLEGSQLEQFLRYVQQTLQLNFGRSYTTNRGVMEEIWSAMPATIALVGVATILSTLIGLWMGAAAGWRRGTTKDRVLTSSSMVTWSMPDFWLGMLLLTFFAVRLGLVPDERDHRSVLRGLGIVAAARSGLAHDVAVCHARDRVRR